MSKEFPRTIVGGVSLPRLLIGSNWFLGCSHKTAQLDKFLTQIQDEETIAKVLESYLEYGIDAFMCCISQSVMLQNAIKRAEDKTGKGIIVIDTPVINVSNTAEGRREAEKVIKEGASHGAKFCLPHHSSVERLVRKDSETIERLPDYLQMARDAGMVPGLSAHMPEIIVFSDKNEYDVETYVQIFNCMGFLMQVEVEYIHQVIWDAKKPVMTIKPMAAGRVTPFVGLTFSFNAIRSCDMVTIGVTSTGEVHEDVEIAMAAIERRRPNTEGRNSVASGAIVKKK